MNSIQGDRFHTFCLVYMIFFELVLVKALFRILFTIYYFLQLFFLLSITQDITTLERKFNTTREEECALTGFFCSHLGQISRFRYGFSPSRPSTTGTTGVDENINESSCTAANTFITLLPCEV